MLLSLALSCILADTAVDFARVSCTAQEKTQTQPKPRGRLVDGKAEGTWVFFHPNGNKHIEGEYRAGREHGRFTYYYPDGRVQSKGEYVDGAWHGRWEVFSVEGFRESVGPFEQGKKHGKWTVFYPDGKRLREEHFVEGVLHGRSTGYYSTGQRKETVRYEDGVLHGKLISWHITGTRHWTGWFRYGRKEGVWLERHANGRRFARGEFERDQRQGMWRQWFPDGLLRNEGAFLDDQQHGPWQFWLENGALSAEGSFAGGERVGEWTLYHDNREKARRGRYEAGHEVGVWMVWDREGREVSADIEVRVQRRAGLLDELQSQNPDRFAAAQKSIDALPDLERIGLLLKGIRSPARHAAVWCAARLTWQHTDVEEAKLLVRLLQPELYKPRNETPIDFDEFRWNLSSEELGPVLRGLAKAKVTVEPLARMIGALHRQVRPVHYPVLCEIYLRAAPDVASSAMGNLSAVIMRTLQHKESIGKAILRRRFDTVARTKRNSFGLARESSEWEPAASKRGYSSVLHDLLREFFLEERHAADAHQRFRRWLFRWSMTEQPAAVDRPVLRDMLRSTDDLAQRLALHGLRRLADPESRPLLETWRWRWGKNDKTDPGLHAICLVGLERCGVVNVRERLLSLARKDADALRTLIGHDAAAGRAVLCEPLGEAAPRGDEFATRLTDLLEVDGGFAERGIPVPDAFYIALEEPVLAARLTGWQLARVCQALPSPSKRLVRVAATRLATGDHGFTDTFHHQLAEYLTLLEVTDVKALRRMLRARIAKGDLEACEHLLPFAEEQDVPAFVRWHKSGEGLTESEEWSQLWFSKNAEVRAKIEEGCKQLDPFCMEALGRIHGLPVEFVWHDESFADSTGHEILRTIRAGKPIDAVLIWLDASKACGDWSVRGLGTLRDERIRAYLLEAREQRHLGLYWVATQELARQGDAAARRMVDEVCRIGRYHWTETDSLSSSVAIPRPDLATIRFWASEVETNCCRGHTAWLHLTHRLAWLDDDQGDQYRSTIQLVETYLRRCGNRLAWSKLVKKFVPVPR